LKNSFICFLLIVSFSSVNLLADQWDGFFQSTGFPRKIIDNGSVVKGKLYEAIISYQILNNDGVKGNFEKSDTAKIIVKNIKGKMLSTEKFMTGDELKVWGRQNFAEIFSLILGDNPQITGDKIKELSSLASIVLLNNKLN
jgi:hypothetical protein